MTIDRQELEELLEAYALHLLDETTRRDVELALDRHPDLRDRAVAMQHTLSLLAEGEEAATPSELRATALRVATDRRPPGRAIGDPPPADPARCYRDTADDLSALLDTLDSNDFDAKTIYGTTVAELVAHLCAVEAYCRAALAHRPYDGDLSDGHLALTDPSIDRRDRAGLVARWRAGRDQVAAVADELSTDALAAEVTFHETTLRADQLLVTRAFELWTHAEDIARAVGGGDRPPSPAVLRTMADTATDVLSGMLGGLPAHRDKSLRVTLTGPGGGSWVLGLGPGGSPVDELAVADATLVADVIDFCRLVADRVRPAQSLAAVRQGDDELLDDLLALTPTLAEYGERTPGD